MVETNGRKKHLFGNTILFFLTSATESNVEILTSICKLVSVKVEKTYFHRL